MTLPFTVSPFNYMTSPNISNLSGFFFLEAPKHIRTQIPRSESSEPHGEKSECTYDQREFLPCVMTPVNFVSLRASTSIHW